jgi:hypothetical protein
MAGTVKDLQVEHQHAQREQIKENPEVEQGTALEMLKNCYYLMVPCKTDACRACDSTMGGSFLPSSFAADPVFPNAIGLHHFYALALAHGLLDLVVGETRANFLVQICEFQCQ